ncbi:MAG: hypothetical protein K8S55_02680 [Phycisphaerae bacterium]|nr:hypothetical protein [Phycisphaerae bacterium]
MKRVIWTCCFILLCNSLTVAADKPKYNVDFSIGWGGCYRPMEWTPLEIQITSNHKKPFGGLVSVSADQDDLTKLTVAHPMVLTPDLPLHLPLVSKFTFNLNECKVRIDDHNGRFAWENDYKAGNYQNRLGNITAVTHNDLLIGMVGGHSANLRNLPKHYHSQSQSQSNENGQIHLKRKLLRMLPWDWTGYASLDLLVLYNPDWNKIRDDQAEAIVQWVGKGGKVLFVFGSKPLPGKHPLAKLLPQKLAPQRKIRVDLRKVLQFRSQTASIKTVNATLPQGDPLPFNWETDEMGTNSPLYAVGPVGFGQVGMLAFNPNDLGTLPKKRGESFWARQMNKLLGSKDITLGKYDDSDNNDYSFQLGDSHKSTNRVLDKLLQIPELKPLNIWWVVLLLGLLAVAIGPVDYFVLKRLGKLPWTWITTLTMLVVFSWLAYYGVRWIRGNVMRVQAVSVVDGIAGGSGWETRYMGIFASASDDYQLDGLARSQWWSSIAPTRNEDYYYYDESNFAMRRLICLQQDGSNVPQSVPISIWSMQCLMEESPAPAMPLAAQVRQAGREWAIRIINLSDTPIRQGYVQVTPNKAVRFEAVPAKGTIEIRKPAVKNVNSRSYLVSYSEAFSAHGTAKRTKAIDEYLHSGASIVYAEYDNAPLPVTVKDRTTKTNHVKLARLVVFSK